MTLTEARKILGLGPDEDPRPHLSEFRAVRERIAEIVRSAPNETLAIRHQADLIEFDQALAAVQEYLEALGLTTSPPPPAAEESPVIAEEEMVESVQSSRALSYLAWFLVFLIGVSGGAWLFWKNEQFENEQRQIRIAFLERQGSMYIENRSWADAEKVFEEIGTLAPDSELVQRGLRSIEVGMAEEQTQFISYWNGQAAAELEAGRLDEAVAAAGQVLARYPQQKDAAEILERAAAARAGQALAEAVASLLAEAREALELRQWDAAISSAEKILALSPGNPDAPSIIAEATATREQAMANEKRALDLLEMAAARDQGEYDGQALEWIREARSLAPDNREIAEQFEKLSSYTRTIRVPGDFETPSEALDGARDRDRIVIAAETWKGPLIVNAAVEIEGAGAGKTIIECEAESGSVITIGPDAKGARISGITFRHESFDAGTARFSVALVRGGTASFVDCRFIEASGHGLAVIEGGQASASRCRFADNGWNGVAGIGQGTTLEVRDSEALNNFENGIETWQEAAATLVNNRCEGNSRNGIHTDNGSASASIEGNQLIANREFGLVLNSAASGKITGNTARGNLLGGLVIRKGAAALPCHGNKATLNQGPGLVLEIGLVNASYHDNAVEKNSGEQIRSDIDLSTPEEDPVESPEIEPSR
jgi:parallel beta-helix repeat protein